MANQETIKLEGQEAIQKWLKGKDHWNAWVKQNPIADVSFSGVDFRKHIHSSGFTTQFQQFKFPTGRVDFSGAIFRDGNIEFSGANFGDGNVFFSRVNFGHGMVNFQGAQFGEGNVNFAEAQFGEGSVIFDNTNFGKGHVVFPRANFGNSRVTFSRTKFGTGDVHFNDAIFGTGDVHFNYVSFGKGSVDFMNVKFEGNTSFSNLRDCYLIKSFSFRNVSFDKTFIISGDFGCVVDMVGTKTSHHVELSGLTCQLKRKRLWGFLKKANDEKDAARLLRLKELTEINKDHAASLRFHADEMRAKRWQETGIFASCLDILFDLFSNYGQSIWRPVAGLALLSLILPSFLNILSIVWDSISVPIEKETLRIVISNSLPFLPASRSGVISITNILHQFFAFIFIFLIGLGLRNRFRI